MEIILIVLLAGHLSLTINAFLFFRKFNQRLKKAGLELIKPELYWLPFRIIIGPIPGIIILFPRFRSEIVRGALYNYDLNAEQREQLLPLIDEVANW